jgi:hypothetical protein
MKFVFLSLSLITFSFYSSAQTAKDFLIGMNFDMIKSDNDGYFEKAQAGVEVNYFISRKLTATTGIEVWTRDGASAVIGARWFPVKDAYIRFRGLIGADDLSIGGGWAKPMTEKLRFESMADFYFAGDFCIRAGLAYRITKAK